MSEDIVWQHGQPWVDFVGDLKRHQLVVITAQATISLYDYGAGTRTRFGAPINPWMDDGFPVPLGRIDVANPCGIVAATSGGAPADYWSAKVAVVARTLEAARGALASYSDPLDFDVAAQGHPARPCGALHCPLKYRES